LTILSFGCQKDTSTYTTVRYIENVCCENLEIVITDNTKPQAEFYYATNLNAVGIPDNYEYGDSILIDYKCVSNCAEAEDEEGCIISCDRSHGQLIKILDVEDL